MFSLFPKMKIFFKACIHPKRQVALSVRECGSLFFLLELLLELGRLPLSAWREGYIGEGFPWSTWGAAAFDSGITAAEVRCPGE